MKRSALLVLVLVFAFVGLSKAGDRPLDIRGVYAVYAVQGQDVCVGRWVYNPFGSNPTWPSSVWTKTSNIHGTETYGPYPDRKGVSELTFFNMVHPVYTPVPGAPYYGFMYNGGPLPTTTIVWQLGQQINNQTWPQQWPDQPPWPFSAGSITIGKSTAEVERTISSDGIVSSNYTGSALITFGVLAGKYVKYATRYATGHMSADKKVALLSSTVPDTPTYDNFWDTIEFYNDAALTDFFGSQEEICQRQRTLIWLRDTLKP